MYGRLENDSITVLVKFIMKKKFKFWKQNLEPNIIPAVCVLANKNMFEKKSIRNQYHKVITLYL